MRVIFSIRYFWQIETSTWGFKSHKLKSEHFCLFLTPFPLLDKLSQIFSFFCDGSSSALFFIEYSPFSLTFIIFILQPCRYKSNTRHNFKQNMFPVFESSIQGFIDFLSKIQSNQLITSKIRYGFVSLWIGRGFDQNSH